MDMAENTYNNRYLLHAHRHTFDSRKQQAKCMRKDNNKYTYA